VGALVLFCSGPGQSYVLSVFIDPILRDTGLSRTYISGLYALGTVVSAIGVTMVGRLVDRIGARRMLAAIGLALGLACCGMAAASGPLGLLLAFAALRALGQGALPITATLLAAQWFVRRRGHAMAILAIGGAVANAALPPLARALISGLGWRGAYVVLGIGVWILLIPAALLVVRDRPEDMGLTPDGGPARHARERPAGADGRLLRTRDFWVLVVPLMTTPFVTTALVFHQESLFAAHGLGPAVSAAAFVPYSATSLMASVATGALIARLGPRPLVILMQVVLLAAVGILQVIATPLAAALYAATLGVSSGIAGVTAGVTWAHYYGRSGLGRVQGTATMVTISAAAIAPLPLALAHQVTGDYAPGLGLMAAVPILGAAVAGLGRPPIVDDRATWPLHNESRAKSAPDDGVGLD
jgi:MFS family permease